MNESQKALIQITKYALNGETSEKFDCDINEVMKLARAHGIANIPGLVFDHPDLREITFKKVIKSMNQAADAQEILDECEKRKIFAMPLKGFCTRARYKNIDARTMGDIDILYKSEQDKELHQMMEELGYAWRGENIKHDHYSKKPYTSIEMHREILGADSSFHKFYIDIWEKSKPKDGYQYIYEMSIEEEFVFNIVHLVSHFLSGGIGIRLIMDIYVYSHIDMDMAKVRARLCEMNLIKFYDLILRLSEKWFGNDPDNCDPKITKLEDYILESGLYGNEENRKALAVSKSRFNFLKRRLFPPLSSMKTGYLFLEKYPFLLPYAWIKRGFTVCFKRKDALKGQTNIFISGDTKKGKEIKEFYKELGIEQ